MIRYIRINPAGQQQIVHTSTVGCPAVAPLQQNIFMLGDLHGSALKLVMFLLRSGICSLPQAELIRFSNFYTNYVRIRNNPAHLISLEDERNYQINFQVLIANCSVLLIGDILCDRGQSDYLTLYVIHKIRTIGINIQSILGNHDFLGVLSFGCVFAGRANDRLTNLETLGMSTALRGALQNQEYIYLSSYHSRDDSLYYFPQGAAISPAFKQRFTDLFLEFLESVFLIKLYIWLSKPNTLRTVGKYNNTFMQPCSIYGQ